MLIFILVLQGACKGNISGPFACLLNNWNIDAEEMGLEIELGRIGSITRS